MKNLQVHVKINIIDIQLKSTKLHFLKRILNTTKKAYYLELEYYIF